MTAITFNQQSLTVKLKGIDRLLAFKGRVEIPLADIEKAEHNDQPVMDFRHATFVIGTIFAGRVQIGTFKENGKKSFWDVHDPKKAILITLKHDTYSKLVIEVEHPEDIIKQIQSLVQ